MAEIKLEGYYDRYDPSKQYERLLFRESRALQSAELNELQRMLGGQLRGVGDALFKDGDIIRDARVTVDEKSGKAVCEAGLIYLAGAVRAVPAATLQLPSNSVGIGVFLTWKVVTELDDPSLHNPAIGAKTEGEPGAARLRAAASWGLSTQSGAGEFYPVHTMDDEGNIDDKEPPPSLDAVTQSLARYDRDSSGGSYVIEGLEVLQLPDDAGHQVYTVAAGRARVDGFAVTLDTARRLNYAPQPDLTTIDTEPHISAGPAAQRVLLNHVPAGKIHKVRITRESTATVTRGPYRGGQDVLPEGPVVSILAISQNGTNYSAAVDYSLTGGRVDWSAGGNEPAPGSTYSVRYQHLADAVAENPDSGGFTLKGAVAQSQIWVTYDLLLPRLDQICLTKEGRLIWTRGVASQWNPRPPAVEGEILPLATVCKAACNNDPLRRENGT